MPLPAFITGMSVAGVAIAISIGFALFVGLMLWFLIKTSDWVKALTKAMVWVGAFAFFTIAFILLIAT